MKKILIIWLTGCFVFAGCEELFNLGDQDALTTDEVIEGLKTALEVGTDTTVAKVSVTDGYYLDEILKITLPDEASVITDNLDNVVFQTLGLTTLLEETVEKVILSVNRSAEEAAKGAAPIFKDAIRNMTVSDAWAILHGKNPAETKKSEPEFDSTAATAYLKSTTYQSLTELYTPIVNNALDQDLGLGFSANDAWNTLTGTYNLGAESVAGQIAGLTPVETELDVFVVTSALNGLFYKVGLVEKDIRKDPLAWASTAVGAILKKVFGS